MPHPRVVHVVVDCADAAALATFWANVLGWRVAPGATEQFATIGGDGQREGTPGWLFFRVPEPKTAKNRMHVDLDTEDLAAEVERLVELGATVVHEKNEWGAHWLTFTDPEGNEFCLVEREGSS